jgi:tetratricopeptide (TPR) repeat protein
MNLGNALLRLGERGDGTAQLEQAVAAYRSALELDKMTIDHANIQFNMAIALAALGKRTESTDTLKEALLRFRKACKVFAEAGMLQLSIPCAQAITPLRDALEPGPPSSNEPSKPAG